MTPDVTRPDCLEGSATEDPATEDPATEGAAALDRLEADIAPVAVVGAGPVGCVLALELAARGVRCVVLERSQEPSRHPKMDYVSGRSMELLRRLAVSEEIRERGIAPHHEGVFLWTLGFEHPPVTSWRHPSVDEWNERFAGYDDGTAPTEAYQRVQGSLLEDLLRRRATDHPLIDVRDGVEVTAVAQDVALGTVSLHGTDRRSGRPVTVTSRYAIGCDGANSAVRQAVGIGMTALGDPVEHLSVYFRSDDPVLRSHGRAFVVVAARGLTLVSRDEDDTWTGSVPLLDGFEPQDPVAELRQRLGVPFAVREVLSTARWEGRLAVADSYRVGRVLVAGDAAHRFFPTGGYGANTGLADAVDLGWKLAAVLDGWGGEALLESYEAERRPVATVNLEVSGSLLDVWRRFGRLGRAGASPELLAGMLERHSFHQDNLGVHFDYRYTGSPVVVPSDGTAPDWRWDRPLGIPWPGCRVPASRTPDGGTVHDLLGPDLTLVDLTPDGAGERLAKEAQAVGVPVLHRPLAGPGLARRWGCTLVLVRPDQHVAWQSDTVPDNWADVLDRVRGVDPAPRPASAPTTARSIP